MTKTARVASAPYPELLRVLDATITGPDTFLVPAPPVDGEPKKQSLVYTISTFGPGPQVSMFVQPPREQHDPETDFVCGFHLRGSFAELDTVTRTVREIVARAPSEAVDDSPFDIAEIGRIAGMRTVMPVTHHHGHYVRIDEFNGALGVLHLRADNPNGPPDAAEFWFSGPWGNSHAGHVIKALMPVDTATPTS